MDKIALDVLIFDIDGVLIDVAESYRTAIRDTVQLYLQEILGLGPFAGELVSREDVAAFKLAGGFNNDWDLTTGIVKYFVSLLEQDHASTAPADAHAAPLDILADTGRRIHTSVGELARRKDIPRFARAVAQSGGGLEAVWKALGTKNDHLLLASGIGLDTNMIKRIFEEMYLGEEYFQQQYGQPAQLVHGPGLIRREQRIVSPPTLETLVGKLALGIATGRPRRQAEIALDAASISRYFGALVAHEDIMAEEEQAGGNARLGKPHPFALLEAARRLAQPRARCAYIGDTLDDVRAANAAKAKMNFRSIGCLAPAEDKQAMRSEFERAGADVIIDHPDELVGWVE